MPRRPPDGADGFTLIELMVAMVLLSVVGTLVGRAIIDAHKMVRLTDDQTQGLSDVRVAGERLVRDVRDARSVVCNPAGTPAALAAADQICRYHLQLWVDYNSDYAQQASETVTWQLRAGSYAGQFDLLRTAGGAEAVEARTIVTQVAFSYDLLPAATAPLPGALHTTAVTTDMSYDAVLARGTSTKTVSLTARLRNVR